MQHLEFSCAVRPI